MYSYILIDVIPYDGTWINGVVNSLEEATVYFDNKVKRESDYFDHYVEVYDGTQKISIFKFNVKTRTLERTK